MEILRITLEAARVNAYLTQKEAAKQLGVSNCTLGKWERRETFPNAEMIDKLCKLYGIPYDNIIF